MPGVMNDPEVMAYEECTLSAEQPQARATHPEFWRTVVQCMKRHRVHTPHGTPSSSYGLLHRMDTPADVLARQYPSLYIRAYAGV